MDILLSLMYVIEFLVAALLVLVILVQRSKAGGGLGGLATTSSGVEEAFGSDAGNVLVKITIYLAIVFGINTIGIGIAQGVVGKNQSTGVAPIAQNAVTEPSTPKPVESSAPSMTGSETTPAETTPAETTPAETTPAETTPAETKPAETTPAETTPAETKPAPEKAE